MESRISTRKWTAILALAGLAAGLLLAALALQGSLYDVRGPVDVSYPAGEVKEVEVLGGLDVYVDGEPKPGFSVFGAIALLMLATACFVTFAALRFAGAHRRRMSFWLIAAAGLAVAGADELLALHESAGHNLPFLADLPGVERPDDVLMFGYLVGALVFAWSFRDLLGEHRLTYRCMIAAIGAFALSAAGDLASKRIEEWFELIAGLFVATALVTLMYRHLKTSLQIGIRVLAPSPASADTAAETEPTREPALRP